MTLDITQSRLRSQRVSDPAATVQEAVRSLGAVQGQDYGASLWAVGLRTRKGTSRIVEAAIADGSIVRTWPMRGTLHLVAAGDARWMLELLGPEMVATHARRFRELGITEALVARSQALMSAALCGGRRLVRGQLYEVLKEGGIPGGDMAYHLAWRAAHDRVLCIGPREGKQPTFVLFDDWIPASSALPREEALARIANRYFTGHGPATIRDLGWWSGLKAADARQATAAAEGIVSRHIDGRDYWFAEDALDSTKGTRRTFVLPAFDEYLVGYRDRAAALRPELMKVVNAGGGLLAPVVVRGGQVVATWKRKTNGKVTSVVVKPFGSPSMSWKRDVETAFRRYLRFVPVDAEIEFQPAPVSPAV